MNDSITRLLVLWLTKANYIFDERYFRQQFLSHPDAPGVSAITDSLNDISIANLAVEIPLSELHKLDHAFMAYIKQDREEQFALVQKKSSNTWELRLQADQQITISTQKFKQLFTGLVVLIDPAPATRSRVARKLLQKQYVIPAAIVLVFVITFFNAPIPVTHFLFGVAGILASMLIVAKELGFNTRAFEKFCNLTAITNCDVVLKSRYSTFFGNTKAYDVSLVFFGLQTLTWLLCYPLEPIIATYQYMGSIVVVPVTIVSLFLQRFVLKKWCPLCLFICGVLWAQAAIAAFVFFNGANVEFSFYLIFTFVMSAVVLWVAWQLIKNLLYKAIKNEELGVMLLSFRRNYHLFMPLYKQLPELETSITGIRDIVMGAPNAPLKMIIVSNPLCATCIALHNQTHQWVKQYPDLSITIRFYVPVENTNDKRTLVAAKLVELYMQDPGAGIAEMNAWYDNTNFEVFYQRNSRMHSTDALEVLKLHRKWCLENNIFITPSIIVNGKRFPMFYEPGDVGFYLDDLIRTLKPTINYPPPKTEALNVVLS